MLAKRGIKKSVFALIVRLWVPGHMRAVRPRLDAHNPVTHGKVDLQLPRSGRHDRFALRQPCQDSGAQRLPT